MKPFETQVAISFFLVTLVLALWGLVSLLNEPQCASEPMKTRLELRCQNALSTYRG